MAPVRVAVKPALLRWARERARLEPRVLANAFPLLAEWERETAQPTLKQLEQYARRTHAPIGYFFLNEPPNEPLPIPDFRTIRNDSISAPSADLLDTIYLCQQRQHWFRDYAELAADQPLAFVGSIRVDANVVESALSIRNALGLTIESRAASRTWEEALSEMIRLAEDLGVLVMKNGIVENNTHRKLDRDEFRGFALSDPFAPVIFINAADSKSGQMFTLAHELAHVFSNRTGLSDASARSISTDETERWCNAVAAEVLVPLASFVVAYRPTAKLDAEMQRLARWFKVSTLVVLRRMYDAGGFSREAFWSAYDAEVERIQSIVSEGSGGDFYRSEAIRVSRRFATALIANTLEGGTLFTDAFRLLGISKARTFQEFSVRLGFVS